MENIIILMELKSYRDAVLSSGLTGTIPPNYFTQLAGVEMIMVCFAVLCAVFGLLLISYKEKYSRIIGGFALSMACAFSILPYHIFNPLEAAWLDTPEGDAVIKMREYFQMEPIDKDDFNLSDVASTVYSASRVIDRSDSLQKQLDLLGYQCNELDTVLVTALNYNK